MKNTFLICLLLIQTVISYGNQADYGDGIVILEKKTDTYSLKLSEIAENTNSDESINYNKCLFQEDLEDGYKVYVADIPQLFSYCLDVEYYQVSSDIKSNKFYMLEYHTADKSKTDSQLTKELLNHFGLKLEIKQDKKLINFVCINSQKDLNKYIDKDNTGFKMSLDEGIYNFENFTMHSLIKILDHAMVDYHLATEIPSDIKYSFKLKKCSEIDDLKANFEKLGLTLKQREVSTNYYHLKKAK
jgi:hypothetical protein